MFWVVRVLVVRAVCCNAAMFLKVFFANNLLENLLRYFLTQELEVVR